MKNPSSPDRPDVGGPPFAYEVTWLVTTVLLSVPVLAWFRNGVVSLNPVTLAMSGGVLAALWGGWALLRWRPSIGYVATILIAAGLAVPILRQLAGRMAFIQENGRMEGPNGEGSPMAFLIGMVFEIALLLPLAAVIIVGLSCLPGWIRRRSPREQ